LTFRLMFMDRELQFDFAPVMFVSSIRIFPYFMNCMCIHSKLYLLAITGLGPCFVYLHPAALGATALQLPLGLQSHNQPTVQIKAPAP
jgi:hypothetical protein